MFVQQAKNVAEFMEDDTTFSGRDGICEPTNPTQVHRWLLEVNLVRLSAYVGPRTFLLHEADSNFCQFWIVEISEMYVCIFLPFTNCDANFVLSPRFFVRVWEWGSEAVCNFLYNLEIFRLF